MSTTPAQVTEAHRKLATDLCRNATGSNRALHHVPKFAQLIADSEAQAVEPWRTQVEELRGALALGQQNCDDVFEDLREERDTAIARAEKAEFMLKQSPKWDTVAIVENRNEWEKRAVKAETILGKLQELHGCSQEMVVHWCERAAKHSADLVREREKVRVLREAFEAIGAIRWAWDGPCGADRIASAALAATEDKP